MYKDDSMMDKKETPKLLGFWTSSSPGNLKNTKEHNVLETDPVSETLCSLEYLTMDKVQKKIL
jgi:hypothetical protein